MQANTDFLPSSFTRNKQANQDSATGMLKVASLECRMRMEPLIYFPIQAENPNTNEIITAEDHAAMLVAAKHGDPEAFDMLFRAYRRRIFLLARRYFAPGADRDDLLQEATIGFFKAIRDFCGDRGGFSSFVELCVRRQIITFIKSATRQKHAALNWATSLDAPVFEDSDETLLGRLAAPGTIEGRFDEDGHEFLEELWSRCSPLEQGVLSMYARGFSFEEMARELGVHYKSIDNAVWRVKVKARKIVAENPKKVRKESDSLHLPHA
jgi:RNA polymerase sporulation-specific sigma factor